MVIVKGPPVVGEVKYRNGSGTANTDAERPNSSYIHWSTLVDAEIHFDIFFSDDK